MSRDVSTEGAVGIAEDPFVHEVPGVCGGYPVVRNTRIPVSVIVQVHCQLGSFERTAEYFSQLTREQLHGALAYYVAHPKRVDEDIERNARTLAELQRHAWPA